MIAELKPPMARPAGRFKVRIISDPAIISSPEKPIEYWTKCAVQDFEEVYTINKHNTLFRFLLKIKDGLYNPASIQLTFSVPQAPLIFQLFDYDNLIFTLKGRQTITIPVYLFFPSEDPIPKQAEKAKDDKSNASRDKNTNSQVFFLTLYLP